MLFLTQMKTLPSRAEDQTGFLKRMKSVAPPPGINIRGVYFLFGRYDEAILFKIPDHRTAKEFILRAATPAIYETETLGAIPAQEL